MATNYQNQPYQATPVVEKPYQTTPIVEKTSDTSPWLWAALAVILVAAGYFTYATYYSPTQKMDMRADPAVATSSTNNAAPATTTEPTTMPANDNSAPATSDVNRQQ